MIVVKLELWPNGNESKSQSLGVAHIANESNLSDISSYSIKLLKSAMYSSPRNVGQVWRQGEVHGWPRTSKQVGPWELLYLALESALGSNRIRTARDLCRKGRESLKVKYAIGISLDTGEYGMTHGPYDDLSTALNESPEDSEEPDGRFSYIIQFGPGEKTESIYVWLDDEWVSLASKILV